MSTLHKALLEGAATVSSAGVDETIADFHRALVREHTAPSVPADENQPWRKYNSEPDLPREAKEDVKSLKTPGGFRRDYLHTLAESKGIPFEDRPAHWNKSLVDSVRPLIRVGYFERVLGIYIGEDGEESSGEPAGNMSVMSMTLATAKSFVGSGITFLPGAFGSGGWAFSTVAMVSVAAITAFCIRLLLECGDKLGTCSFGEIASKAAGRWGKLAVQVSLVVSQFGTNVAFIIFICHMAKSLGATQVISLVHFVGLLISVLIPLSFVRSVHRLEYPILGADVLILVGLLVVIVYSVKKIMFVGVGPHLEAFQPDTCGLLIGTSVFSFEGTPLVLPIKQSMANPELYWPYFKVIFVGIVVFFVGFSFIGYVAFGSEVRPVIIENLPSEDPLIISVRAAYAAALLLSSPLTFLPGTRTVEFWIFGVSKVKGEHKWQKNAIRSALFILFGWTAIYGGMYFQQFVAICGAVCCAPIALIYPPWFHYKLCAATLWERALDVVLITFGLAVAALVLCQALGLA